VNKRKNKKCPSIPPPRAAPPSKLRAAPRVPYCHTLRPRWPLLPTGGPAVLPTSVVARKSRSAWLHHSSANSSAILVRSLPRVGPRSFLVTSKTVVQRVYCWLFHCGQFLNRCSSLNLILAPPRAGVRASSGPCKVTYCPVRQPRLELVEAVCATVGSGFCFSLGSYLRFLVLSSLFLALHPLLLRNPRLTLARDLGRGNFLFLTWPLGSLTLNHSTP